MRSAICAVCFFAYLLFSNYTVNSQVLFNDTDATLPANNAVSVEAFDWAYKPDSSGIGGRFSVTNKTQKAIRSITFSLVAYDRKGIILQEQGATIKKLTSTTPVAAGATGEILFKELYRLGHIARIDVQQVTVEFANGSLEVLR